MSSGSRSDSVRAGARMPREPVTDSTAVRAAAERLAIAATTGAPSAAVRHLIGPDDVESAYAVQRIGVRTRLAAGARIVGRKIGLTSPAVQQQLGVKLAWLARTTRDFGAPLRAGEIVLSGALGPMAALRPGARVRSELFSGTQTLGAVDFTLEEQ
ncbi:hypothetical protein [Nocardia sp. CA-135398]|uniref:hypothetical protein n=1 Tax=Nocardia sp. CA-135398 TaxID=3239977 RepID=UPI003D95C3D6